VRDCWGRLFGRLSRFQGLDDLRGNHAVGVIGLLHRGVEQLEDIDERKDAGDEEHQAGDGEDEFGLQAHGLGLVVASRYQGVLIWIFWIIDRGDSIEPGIEDVVQGEGVADRHCADPSIFRLQLP